MANNQQSLAVGLAVGIPSFLIITVTLLLWYRNQQKQLREDNLNKEIDVELRDDQSFNAFQEELHRKKQFLNAPIIQQPPYDDDSNPNKSYSTTTQAESSSNEKNFNGGSSSISSNSDNTNINPNSNSNNNIVQSSPLHPQHQNLHLPPQPSHLRPQTPNKIHQKSPSAYDFYETFIPVLPSSNQSSTSQTDINNIINNNNTNANSNVNANANANLQPYNQPPSIRQSAYLDQQSANSSNTSLFQPSPHHLDKQQAQSSPPTLDQFAKQLNSPSFFEKLPSRAAPPQMSLQRQLQASTNNSSSELLVNRLVGDEAAAINDHYVYEPPSAEVLAQELQLEKEINRHKSQRSHS
ncbi:uncharacterized protein RJT21DRAFT_46665 [Scheffersomyces amazonensis]|uniref:uncharacterized protein n=1 Tax=Scheffersomyces amazonensis TaxID=1078765 RepID=UPI00315DC221